MKKSVVIGPFGFIGFALCNRLLEEGSNVLGLEGGWNDTGIMEEKLLEIGRNSNFEWLGLSEVPQLEEQRNIDRIFVDLYGAELNKEALADIKKMNKFYQASGAPTVLIVPLGCDFCLDGWGKPSDNVTVVKVPSLYGPWQPPHFYFHRLISSRIKNVNDPANPIEKNIQDVLFIEDAARAIVEISMEKSLQKAYVLSSGLTGQWQEAVRLLDGEPSSNLIQKEYGTKESTLWTVKQITPLSEGLALQEEHMKRMDRGKSI